jgi:phosphatidylinositol alpha-mannosyltransferase
VRSPFCATSGDGEGVVDVRIAMISYYLPSESKIGVGYQVHELAGALVARGHDVTVYSGCKAPEESSYETVQVPLAGGNRTFKFALALRRVDFSTFDVLHAHGDDYWLWRSRAAVHVRTIHGSCFEEARRIHGWREKLRMLLLGFSEVLASVVADSTVVVSPQTRRWTPWVRRVIPNGVDLDRFAEPVSSRREQVPTVLFVGTFHQRKRGALLWDVFQREVLPAVPAARLWMVCSDAPEAPGIEVLGRLSDPELRDRYWRASVFCLPSSYEGFGIPYVEAMASGVPVVCTSNPGSNYVTDNGRAGLVVDESELGQTLVVLLRDETRRIELAARGKERSRHFALDSVASQYLDLYSSRV